MILAERTRDHQRQSALRDALLLRPSLPGLTRQSMMKRGERHPYGFGVCTASSMRGSSPRMTPVYGSAAAQSGPHRHESCVTRRRQFVDRGGHGVGRGMVRHMPDALEEHQLGLRQGGGERAGVYFRRHHGVAIAGDDDGG